MDLPHSQWKEHRQRGHDLRQVQGMNSHENKSEQGVAPYVTQGVPRVNADVGSGNILATARTMDPPPPTTQRSRAARKRFGRAKPGTADENGIQQGVPPLRATSGARVNADVGSENNGNCTTNGPSPTRDGKSFDRAGTI